MKNKLLITATTLVVMMIKAHSTPPPDEGKTIFNTRCAACHNVNKPMVGPALNGIDQRRPIEWIINFIHSSQSVVKSGDNYAVALFEKFNKVAMPDHPDLTVDNIKSIVEYIKSESKTSETNKAPFAKPEKKKEYYLPLSIQKDYRFFIIYFIVVGLLIAALLFAVQMKRVQNRMSDMQDN